MGQSTVTQCIVYISRGKKIMRKMLTCPIRFKLRHVGSHILVFIFRRAERATRRQALRVP